MSRLLVRSIHQPEYRHRLFERLARFPKINQDEPVIWVHAVSVGEVIAAVPLIKSLIERYPEKQLLVTTTTPTGSAQVKKIFADEVLHVYAPYDFSWVVKRFLNKMNPSILLVMETEIWPNLFRACHKENIPIILANARLSKRSAVGYQRFAGLTRSTLNCITRIAAQGQKDAERFIELGAKKENISQTGSIKFDMELPDKLNHHAAGLRNELGEKRKIWIAASTHEGEEELMLEAYDKLSSKIDNLLLIIVPRHPERFDRIAALCEKKHLNTVRRSDQDSCTENTQVFLVDSMGELLLFYAVSDVAFIGGSLVNVGGHNLLEAAALKVPSVVGPEMYNFAEITEHLLRCNGIIQIQNESLLADKIEMLLNDEKLRTLMGGNAYAFVDRNKGALDQLNKIIDRVMAHLQERP